MYFAIGCPDLIAKCDELEKSAGDLALRFERDLSLRQEDGVCGQPVSELHFTPGNPRGARLGVSFLF